MAYSNWGDAFWSGANKGAEFGSKLQDRYYDTQRNAKLKEIFDQYYAAQDAANARQGQELPQQAIPAAAENTSIPTENAQINPNSMVVDVNGTNPAPNKPAPYVYDAATREQMNEDAITARDRAIRQAYNSTRAGDQADTALQNIDKTELSKADMKKLRQAQNIWDMFSSDEWLTQPGMEKTIQEAADTISSYTGTNYGKMKIKDGKLYNDTGKGWRELPSQALGMVKRAAAAEMIGMKTGDWGQTKEFLDNMTKMENMGNAKTLLGLKDKAISVRAARGNGGNGKITKAMNASTLKQFTDAGYTFVPSSSGYMFLQSPEGDTQIPTGIPTSALKGVGIPRK